ACASAPFTSAPSSMSGVTSELAPKWSCAFRAGWRTAHQAAAAARLATKAANHKRQAEPDSYSATFPCGPPGAGLLLIRAAVAIPLVHAGLLSAASQAPINVKL